MILTKFDYRFHDARFGHRDVIVSTAKIFHGKWGYFVKLALQSARHSGSPVGKPALLEQLRGAGAQRLKQRRHAAKLGTRAAVTDRPGKSVAEDCREAS